MLQYVYTSLILQLCGSFGYPRKRRSSIDLRPQACTLVGVVACVPGMKCLTDKLAVDEGLESASRWMGANLGGLIFCVQKVFKV